MSKDYKAITIEGNGILAAIEMFVDIEANGKSCKVKAIWDTGATTSCISKRVVQLLQLHEIGYEQRSTANGIITCNNYFVNFKFPNCNINDVRVADFSGDSTIDALIGMDIICSGDFSITNANGKTVFSFRIPSDWWHIDYVAASKSDKKAKIVKSEIKKIQDK